MDDRYAKLGFKPQKEIVYNKLLPYVDELDEESQQYLAEIKTNLGQAILRREIAPEAMYWVNQLPKYMKLYGRKFSKEDHLLFIHLLFDVMFIPDLQLHSVQRIASVLQMLLKKRELLSRDDLVIPWRPLYELYEKSFLSSYHVYGLLHLPNNFDSTLKSLIHASRLYFPVEATQEMLDEWMPQLCPFDSIASIPFAYFQLFLCTKLPPEEHDRGFKLWFEKFMVLWEKFPQWDNYFVWLFSRLAKDNIGYIDWEPYIPLVFSKLMKNLNLPGSGSSTNSTDLFPFVVWISSMLGGGSSCQMYITHLFKALESYYHPSNHGRWLTKLQKLLHKLPVAVVRRLHRERYAPPTWETPVPPSHKLTDAEITEFVLSLKPVALLSMYSRMGVLDCVFAFQNLAFMRPELIIPNVIDRLYSSLETLTEPHRLTAAMQCVSFMARSMVRKDSHFPEGPSHIVPLLMGSLPGIDPNDMNKCLLTFQFISMFAPLILIVDCSKGVEDTPDLTDMQREICLSTAAFEDFILQFLDRAFALIENSSLNNNGHSDRSSEARNIEEHIMGVGMTATLRSLLMQSSPAIYKVALQKLYTFVSSHIFEIKFAGRYAATLCRSAAKVDPEVSLQLFFPHFAKLVMALTENDEVLDEEVLDNELLFSLLLLSELSECDGAHLLKYGKQITELLHRTLHLKCKDGYQLASSLLQNTLRACTTVYALDFCSISDFWTRCGEKSLHMLINEWGKPGDINNIGMKFHIPTDKEMEFAQQLLDTFFIPELENLSAWAKGQKQLTREEVQRSLNIIVEGLTGASASLPCWKAEPLKFRDSSVPMHCVSVKECGTKTLTPSSGKNVRHFVVEVMQEFLSHLLESAEDDTKSLLTVVKIYQIILFHWGITEEEFNARWKGFQCVKTASRNKLHGKKQHTRLLLVDRISLQQDLRMLVKNRSYFTEVHAQIMRDIMKLSISHYGAVRAQAQDVLSTILKTYSYAYKVIFPELLEVLSKDPATHHEEFKGVLYILAGQKHHSLLTVRHWELIEQLWPTVIAAKHSEKPSIIKLQEHISVIIQKNISTFQIDLQVCDKVLERAKCLWSSTSPHPLLPIPPDSQEQECAHALVEKCKNAKRLYYSLVEKLVNLLENGNLHWRQYHLAFIMLLMLIRYDVLLPPSAVRIIVSNLVHDTVAVRKVAITAVNAVLKQQKQKHCVTEVDPRTVESNELPLHPVLENLLTQRISNLWLQYSSVSKPDTKEAWEKRQFLHKMDYGFDMWPKVLKVYSPDSQQPKIDRSYSELSEEEKPVYDCFSQPEFIDKLIKYCSLEGQDKFDTNKCDLFKGLFRNFGDKFLDVFVEKLNDLVVSKQESSQLCAAEIISGILRGSKHWNFEKVQVLKEKLTPVLTTAIKNITHETRYHWGVCMSNTFDNRDPNKYYWILDLLMEEPVEQDSRSCEVSNWLYLLMSVVKHQEWRIFEVLHRLLEYIKPRLNHPYANVRAEMASVLSVIFKYDVQLDIDVLQLAPTKSHFIEHVIPKVAILHSSEQNCEAVSEPSVLNSGDSSEEEEKSRAKNILQTVSRWIIKSIMKKQSHIPSVLFMLLPALCEMKSDSTEDDRQKDCMSAINTISQSCLLPETLDAAIGALKTISQSGSWRSRASSVSILRHMVSSNLFNILRNEQHLEAVKSLILEHLHDERVEVREAAAQALGGLLHCELICVTDELLSSFKEKCKNSLKRARVHHGESNAASTEPSSERPSELISERHAGILGLCACVSAFPYDVPEFMPDILMLLGDHLNDPEPIQGTIKKTLSDFRRTHQDSWRDHKLKFTDDQLAVITDLLVSPSYYA